MYNRRRNHESENDFGGLLAFPVRMAGVRGADRIPEAGIPRGMDTMCERTISGNASPADAGNAHQPA